MKIGLNRQRLLWLSVALSAVVYLAFVLWSGWQQVWLATKQIGFCPIAVALLLSMFNYLLRAERWRLFLARWHCGVPWSLNVRIYFAGFSLTTTPGKAGELIRSVFLRPYGVHWHQSTAMFFSERLADLIAIVIIVACGFTFLPRGELAFFMLILVLLAGLLLLRTHYPERVLRRIAGQRKSIQWLADVASSSRPLWHGRLLWQSQGLSLLAWFAEGIGAWLILRTLMPEISVEAALFVYGFAMLVGALSFLPGGLGGTEATMTGLLVLQGLALPEAVAATIIIRLATLWFAVVVGLIALLSLPDAPRSENNAPEGYDGVV
jgi:uncharacterized membrane protein YbhN (UPF0104 family)